MARPAVLLAALLLACGSPAAPQRPTIMQTPAVAAPPPESGSSREPTVAENRVIRGLMARTEKLRGLAFRAPVSVRIQDRLAIRSYVRTALDEEELRKARRRYVALGLIDPALNVRELIESLMEEELVGYYDPKRKMLAIREDVASSLANAKHNIDDEQWKATVVHELVHALQDQHLGLSNAMEKARTTDEENAFGAVVEGDATLAMLGYLAEGQGSSLAAVVTAPDQLAIALRSGRMQPEGKLAHAPAIVREPLLFRYRDGALFAAQLYADGGWKQIDQAHATPPKSTMTVRSPRRFLDHAQEPTLPALPNLEHHGCAQLDDDVLGSLEVATALADAPRTADVLAHAWRGDRYVILDCSSRDASLWHLRFATPAAAQRARAGFEQLSRASQHERLIFAHGANLLVARGVPVAATTELAATVRQRALP